MAEVFFQELQIFLLDSAGSLPLWSRKKDLPRRRRRRSPHARNGTTSGRNYNALTRLLGIPSNLRPSLGGSAVLIVFVHMGTNLDCEAVVIRNHTPTILSVWIFFGNTINEIRHILNPLKSPMRRWWLHSVAQRLLAVGGCRFRSIIKTTQQEIH